MFTGFLPIYLTVLIVSVGCLLCLLIYCIRQFRSHSQAPVSKVAETRRQLAIDPNDTNVAVCGAYKGGKSRLISAINNINQQQQQQQLMTEQRPQLSPAFACPSSSGSIKCWPHKDYEQNRLIFWEFPGTGNPHVPHGFQYRYDFRAWDYVLIVISDAIREEEIWLADLVSQNVAFSVIKSKCDRDLEQIERDVPTKTPQEIKRQYFIASHQLLEADLGDQISAKAARFLVSATCMEDCESNFRLDEDRLLQMVDKLCRDKLFSNGEQDLLQYNERQRLLLM